MTLRMVNEVEVPNEPPPAPPQPPVQIATPTATKSEKSSPLSPHTVLLLAEIRKILSARAAAMIAIVGASGLTAAAMAMQTTMALLVSISYDILVLMPIIYAAYFKRGE